MLLSEDEEMHCSTYSTGAGQDLHVQPRLHRCACPVVKLVEHGMQGLGKTCMYCGDGINDLIALAAADVGVVIGASDASAAAVFSTKQLSIAGAFLAVTSDGRALHATQPGSQPLFCFCRLRVQTCVRALRKDCPKLFDSC